MISDPFYRSIVQGLESKDSFDGDGFEACAVGLLEDSYPGIVPIPGGNDGGMDGAIADLEGEAFPLVCTTAADFRRNLTKSLKRYLGLDGPRRKVVFATSRRLRAAQRRDLQKEARELGFALVQIYEQRAIATLLYRNSTWCQQLLRLTGQPPALSVIPAKLRRHLIELEIRGREADLEWLRSTSGDRVLVGDPGSGKTYALYQLALKGWGLFLATDAEDRLAKALRDQRPKVVIVDDAHVNLEIIGRLRSLRQQGFPFEIVATTWKGSQKEVQSALGVPDSSLRQLELLTRQEILGIYTEMGISGQEFGIEKDIFLGLLVDQASNLPGLAVTLGTLCLEGDWGSILNGRAIERVHLPVLNRCLGRDETELLGILSLGGRRGMPHRKVGEALGLDLLETRRRMVSLAAAGVLRDRGDGCWSVEPQILRSALLKSVFFSQDSLALDFHEFLSLAPSQGSFVLELVAAIARGADVPQGDVKSQLASLEFHPWSLDDSKSAWLQFAYLGESETLWALENFPGERFDILNAALKNCPDLAIAGLLELSASGSETSNGSNSRPMTALQDWTRELTQPPEATIQRRKLLIRTARTWGSDPNHQAVAFNAACLALTPDFRYRSDGPDRQSVLFHQGLLPVSEMEQMKICWEEFTKFVDQIGIPSWAELQASLWIWIYPDLATQDGQISAESAQLAHDLALKFLQDLVPYACESPGLSSALNRLSSEIGLDLRINLNQTFETLYPLEDPNFAETSVAEKSRSELEQLAEQWTQKSNQEIVGEIARYGEEAKRAGIQYPDRVPELCRLLGSRASDPVSLLRLMIDRALSVDLVQSMAKAITPTRLKTLLPDLFDSTQYCGIAIYHALGEPTAPREFVDQIQGLSSEFTYIAWGKALRGELSIAWLTHLLSADDPNLVAATAYGEWKTNPKGEVRPRLFQAWRDAILRIGDPQGNSLQILDATGHYRLGEILAHTTDLALEWMRGLSTLPSEVKGSRIRKTVRTAISGLKMKDRQQLLEEIEQDSPLLDLLPQIVDGHRNLYDQILINPSLKGHYFEPLRSQDPRGNWFELAETALESGLAPKHVARALLRPFSGSGNAATYWQSWADAFGAYASRFQGCLAKQQLAEYGRDLAIEELADIRSRERKVALHGSF